MTSPDGDPPFDTSGACSSGRSVDEERRAAEREEHARLVVERSGDPAFVRRVRTEAGGAVTWDPSTEMGARLRALTDAQLQAFRDRFGRDPEPDEPVFFDPDATEPKVISAERAAELWDRLARTMAAEGLDPAYAYGAADVGYLVTDANRHLFTALQVEAYLDAVDRHRPPAPTGLEGLEWDGTGSPPNPDAVDPADLRVPHVARALAVRMRGMVARVVAGAGPEHAIRAVDQEYAAAESSDEPAALGLLIEAVFVVLGSWLAGIRDQGVSVLDEALAWTARELGQAAAEDVAVLIEVLTDSELEVDTQAASDRLGRGVVPAMIHLACGAVATAGNGDEDWLAPFDPS